MALSNTDLIRNLLARYCDLMDDGDFDGIGALFAGGQLVDEHGAVVAAGAEAVSAFYQRVTRRHDGRPRTKHLVINTAFDEPGEGGGLVARSSFLVLQGLEGTPLQPIITGRYVDRFAPADAGGWNWVERRFAVDLVGDLSRHLTFDVPA